MNLPNAAGWLRALLASCFMLVLVAGAVPSKSQVVISEFLAENNGVLQDEDGDSPDWIELHNNSDQLVNLLDWSLSDTSTNVVKWRFPAVELAPGAFLVVFASDRDRQVPGEPLHTNFKLGTDGEYLALATPGGVIVSEFAPAYPPQLPNISFGITQRAGAVPVLSDSAPVRVLVPEDGSLGTAWTAPGFNESGWTLGANGVGYETSPAEYANLIRTNLRAFMDRNTSFYIRLPFLVKNPEDYTQWRLLMRYDDGFIAYLNGHEIARRNAPVTATWNSTATANHPDAEALVPEEFDLRPVEDFIMAGTNLLAIHGLNRTISNSDLLILPVIEARPLTASNPVRAYFRSPTPGDSNIGGETAVGPLIGEVLASPSSPERGQDVLIRAEVRPAFEPVTSATLHYRVMFGPEIQLPLWDDGAHQDGAAGDGQFAAVIPAGTAGPGQMIRFYVTAASSGGTSRMPLFLDPRDSAEYFGVVVNSAIESHLPIVHWFVENAGMADTSTGARCAISYRGEFYDNVLFSLHGQSSSGFLKKGYNIDFPRDHRFEYAPGAARVKDIKMLTNWGDKSRVRNALAYEMIREAGSVGHFAFQVRVQRNGEFHAILDMMEDADDRWLERVGLNPDGALYKVYDSLSNAGGSEKKTRKEENFSDLQTLITSLAESRPLTARVTYAYDNIDLPQTISYFTALALVSSQDHGHKNFYVYRDTGRTGEWTIFPWDVDLSWGRNWIDAGGYFTDTLYQNNVLNFYNLAQQNKPSNRLYNLIFNHPDFRQMYLRRLRTVMDTVLQPPGTSAASLKIEARIREMMDAMDPADIATSDANLDYERWGSWGNRNRMRPEAQRIIDVHLPGRRTFLFQNAQAALNGERIPDAQPDRAVLAIGSIEFNPSSGSQAEEYVELLNENSFALDISGWEVTGGIRWTFRPGTVIPGSSRLFLARNVPVFRSRASGPRGGQGLFVQGDYAGQLSARGERLSIHDTSGRLVITTNYPGNPTRAQQFLRLTELMFHPANPAPGSPYVDEDFEFIELRNIGAEDLSLAGAQFTRGVSFRFDGSAVTNLPPGGYVVIVRNLPAFETRYGPGLPVAGAYTGSLDNAGETLRFEDGVGEVVFEFAYAPDWLSAADGEGYSMEVKDLEGSMDAPGNWRGSAQLGGSPGRDAASTITLQSASIVDGKFIIAFRASAGQACAIYHRSDLGSGRWEMLETTIASAGETRVALEIPAGVTSHFYRVAIP
ncbi:MAG: CotH kinase family protein [Verrucomicrobiia bacterium]